MTWSKYRSRTTALVLAALALGCLGPNPLLDAADDQPGTESGDGDPGDGDGDGDGETGDGDGDTGDGDTGEPANCSNGILDGDETDVDCGGSCAPCEDGLSCVEQTDCVSQVCQDLACQAPRCDDGVQNGAELGVDCGGDCLMCSHGPLQIELDDFQGTHATLPQVSMFADGSFVVTYTGPTQARARWFDEYGAPLGPSVELSNVVEFEGGHSLRVVAGVGSDYPIHALEPGSDPMSTSTDLFLIRRTPESELATHRINPVNQTARTGDLTVSGTRATITWLTNAEQILTRRFDYSVGEGQWIDVNPFEAETEPATYTGSHPSMARDAAGVSVVTWVREHPTEPTQVVIRRFDTDWIDPEPILVAEPEVGYAAAYPRAAIGEDGRVAVIWSRVGVGQSDVRATILDAELTATGEVLGLQFSIPGSTVDVAALSDGSFAFVWPDTQQGRVRLRRFIDNDTPKLPDLGDESPWSPWPPMALSPMVSAASIPGRLIVVWSAIDDGVSQIQGQVLSH
jgi:hypothetical protein